MEGFHLVPGDFAGYGDLAYYGNISDTDVCWRLCLNTPRCKSYEFSRTENWCNLNSVDEPNSPQCGDYTFCAKTGDISLLKFFHLSFLQGKTCFYFNINYFNINALIALLLFKDAPLAGFQQIKIVTFCHI